MYVLYIYRYMYFSSLKKKKNNGMKVRIIMFHLYLKKSAKRSKNILQVNYMWCNLPIVIAVPFLCSILSRLCKIIVGGIIYCNIQ